MGSLPDIGCMAARDFTARCNGAGLRCHLDKETRPETGGSRTYLRKTKRRNANYNIIETARSPKISPY